MKKLLSVLAAGVLAFGMIGCSGDLHDDEVSTIDISNGLYLVGSMQGWDIKTGLPSENSADVPGALEIAFTADASKMEFKFIPTLGAWDGQIAGDKIVGGEMPTGCTYESADDGFGGFNAVLDGFEAKANYKMIIEPTIEGTLKVSVKSNVPPTPFYLQNYFIRSGVYEAEWKPTLDSSLNYVSTDVPKGEVYYENDFKYTEGTFNGFQIAKADWDDGRYGFATDTDVTVDGDYVEILSGNDKNGLMKTLKNGFSYKICVKTTPDEKVYVKVVEVIPVAFNVIGCKLDNVGDLEVNTGIYYLENWMPGNNWNADTPNKSTDASSGYTCVFSEPYKVECVAKELASKTLKIQIINFNDSSDFWAASNKLHSGDACEVSCADAEDGKEYIIVFDVDKKTASLVEAE